MRCGMCGKKDMVYLSVKGKSVPWKDYPEVRIETNLELLTCSDCGNIGVKGGESKKVDEAIELSLKKQISSFIDIIDKKQLKDKLSNHGITEMFENDLRKGKIPDFKIFNILKELSKD